MRAVRFEWYQIECGSGSIGRVVLGFVKKKQKNKKNKKQKCGKWDWQVTVAREVAVAGWQWWRWIEGVIAVRMVCDRVWQWQY
jgi:uncharacterized membrane protein YdcZ (DUF606 family)